MRAFNYTIKLIPDFRARKKLLDVTPIIVNSRLLRINPIMTTNLLIMDVKNTKYMADKLAMLYNSIIRDNTLVVTGKGLITKSYVIKYDYGRLSITFGSSLALTVTLPIKMAMVINSDIHKYDKTNFAVMLYVASAIMNIPKYEYPIAIINHTTQISTVTIDDIDVLYAHIDTLPYPDNQKKINDTVLDMIDSLRNMGDVISYIDDIPSSSIFRVLALINYCRYYDVVTPDLITMLISNISTVVIDQNHLDNMISYMEVYRDLINIKDKYSIG